MESIVVTRLLRTYSNSCKSRLQRGKLLLARSQNEISRRCLLRDKAAIGKRLDGPKRDCFVPADRTPRVLTMTTNGFVIASAAKKSRCSTARLRETPRLLSRVVVSGLLLLAFPAAGNAHRVDTLAEM